MMLTPSASAWAGSHSARVVAILAGTAGIATLHYATAASHLALHELYNYLCYVPVIFAAYWYGVWGGLLAAAITAAAFIPHIRSAWTGNEAYSASLYAQVIAFHVLGATVGLLVGAQRRLTERYRDAADSLELANRDLRSSQEHLRRADRLSALGEISAALAHEIKNPLASIKGAVEIIGARVARGTPEAEFADIAGREIGRLEGLLGEFLTYARPHAPKPTPTSLETIVIRVTGLLHAEAEAQGVHFETGIVSSTPAVLADREQITQVLFNVVLNAIQASPRGGVVRIDASCEGGMGVLQVADDGPGIAAEDVSRIFDAFYTTKSGGTGLGLAISHRIVTAHGGSLDVRPGARSGSVFRVRLPLSEPGARP